MAFAASLLVVPTLIDRDSWAYPLELVGNQTATAEARCPGLGIWTERFRYVDALIKGRDFEKAKPILEKALNDCDSGVRRHALDLLTQVTKAVNSVDNLESIWSFVRVRPEMN
jgi:HEAT repeat protein